MTERLTNFFLAGMVLYGAAFALPAPARGDEVSISPSAIKEKKTDSPKLFVVAIGAGTFKDPFWPALKWSEQDARQVAQAFGLNTDRQRVVTLLTGAAVTREALQTIFTEIARQARRKDAVAVYLSTHGTLALAGKSDLEPVLVLPDTTSDNLAGTGLPESLLRRLLDRIPASRKLLIVAACHSGLGKSRLTPRVQEALSGIKGRATKIADVSEGVLVFSASARGETAREDDLLKGDIYTHYFLEALTSFDRNHDGAVSALEAHDYARDRAFARTGGRQRATLEAQSIGDADLILRGQITRDPLPILEARGEELAGIMVSVDSGVKGRLPSAVALSPDKSRVQLYRLGQNKPFATYEVNAPSGARLKLEDLLSGQPWSLGLGYGTAFFQDKVARRTLSGTLPRIELVGGYRLLPTWAIGVGISTMQSSRHTLRSNVSANVAWETLGIYGEYVHTDVLLRGFAGGAGLALGRSRVALNLADESDAMAYKVQANSLAPYVYGDWTTTSDLGLRLSVRYHFESADFGDPGTLYSQRVETMFHVRYHFGGIARRK